MGAGLRRGDPQTCPPVCDQIPDAAWISPAEIPLNSVYHWPSLAAIAVPTTGMATPRFRFEEICATPESRRPDVRDSAVASRAWALTLWVADAAQLPWPIISDARVLEAMTSPVCAVYLGSC